MPLVVLCGFPCSGKSRRALELKAHLEQNGRKVTIIGDHTLDIDKNAVYAESRKEKDLRGALRAEVERNLNKENVVILDSLNYIKGYRYELFCLIKHAQTPHCLIYCVTAPDISSAWNQDRHLNEQYTRDIFDALILRFEAPDSRNRWDSPLFTVQKDDALPLEQICNAIFHRKAPPPNQSTQTQPLSSTNFLHELDKVTQEVVTAVLNAQKTSVPGDIIVLPGASEKISFLSYTFIYSTNANVYPIIAQGQANSARQEGREEPQFFCSQLRHLVAEYPEEVIIEMKQAVLYTVKSILQLPRNLTMSELRRLRQQFISYTKLHPNENISQLANMFVQYLNQSIH